MLRGSHAARSDRRAAFEPLEPRLLLAGDVQISEFMAVNDTTLRDQDNEYVDWIEIHNPTDSPVNLDDWYLTDNETNLTKWQFPAETIGPEDYLVVFASKKDRAVAGSQLHTNFKLDGSNPEYLALVRPDGVTIAYEYAPTFPVQVVDVSYGIGADGGHYYFDVPTPGAANGEGYAAPAYTLCINGSIQETDVLDATTLPQVEMPNRDNFVLVEIGLTRGQRRPLGNYP